MKIKINGFIWQFLVYSNVKILDIVFLSHFTVTNLTARQFQNLFLSYGITLLLPSVWVFRMLLFADGMNFLN